MNEADDEYRRHYLYKVATNLIRRRYRDLASAPLDENASYTAGAPDEVMDVARALNGLTPIERQTLWLTHVEGWSSREVAELLRYREGSIRQVGVRARRRFRELFGGGTR